MQKSIKQMFGGLARQQADQLRMERDEAVERERYATEAEARLEAPLTRRDVLDALESVANEYARAGFPEDDAITNAFRRLAEMLT